VTKHTYKADFIEKPKGSLLINKVPTFYGTQINPAQTFQSYSEPTPILSSHLHAQQQNGHHIPLDFSITTL